MSTPSLSGCYGGPCVGGGEVKEGVAVGEGEGVELAVGVAVGDAVGVGVLVGVLVGVGVGVTGSPS